MRFPRCAIVLSLAALGSLAVAKAISQPTTAPTTRPGPKLWEATDEDYAIFAVVIQAHFKHSRRGVPPHVLIAARTEDWRILDDEELAALDDDGFLFEECPLRLPARALWYPDDLQEVLFDANRQPAQLVADCFRIAGSEVLLIDADSDNQPPRPTLQQWRNYPQSGGIPPLPAGLLPEGEPGDHQCQLPSVWHQCGVWHDVSAGEGERGVESDRQQIVMDLVM